MAHYKDYNRETLETYLTYLIFPENPIDDLAGTLYQPLAHPAGGCNYFAPGYDAEHIYRRKPVAFLSAVAQDFACLSVVDLRFPGRFPLLPHAQKHHPALQYAEPLAHFGGRGRQMPSAVADPLLVIAGL